ncbi:hypothetical protein P4571_02670 [Niallia alba]|uniref:hypothetical protein n=1 Tax=Niallia alba TaxID=2729105 RepID=UPI002E1E02F1|nr:hypothetical protein [Niallia alba]
MDTKDLSNLSLSKLEQKMKEDSFEDNLIKDLIVVLKQRLIEFGERDFQKWLYNLNFKYPEDFQDESFAKEIYEKYQFWVEEEIVRLEKETNISWEVQSEDLEKFDIKARKVQLVIRHRLSEIVLELI